MQSFEHDTEQQVTENKITAPESKESSESHTEPAVAEPEVKGFSNRFLDKTLTDANPLGFPMR